LPLSTRVSFFPLALGPPGGMPGFAAAGILVPNQTVTAPVRSFQNSLISAPLLTRCASSRSGESLRLVAGI
jgi:hypothetical protein